jgi:phage terminase small subunit
MPILDKPKHEKLAQELALGTNQTDAYERAGYARDDSHASRLAGDGRIRARVEELQADAAKLVADRIALSRADMIAMLMSDREEARANKQMATALRATELLGRELHGMFTERREVVTKDDVRQLTDAELHEQMAQAVEAMGAPEFAAKIRRMGQP